MQTHLTILGALYTGIGAFGLLSAAISAIAILGGGLISGDAQAVAVTFKASVFVGVLLAVLAAPVLIGGIGLFRRAAWSRFLVLVLGCLSLLAIPFGTILGIYTIWVLAKPEAAQLLSA
ncbi:MAG: hypothetical protein L0Z62_43560 [Gemmataceae bacterium]|nr:hypothetical protein [Gemmataceae bacterium]